MRIVAGSVRGREIVAPDTAGTRPISDKAREALFNILGDVTGLTWLDTYAGSGAIGLEALSRGAASVTGVEQAKPAAAAVRANVDKLDFTTRYRLDVRPVERWLGRNAGRRFDIISADPPFRQLDAGVLNELAQLLVPGGVLILKYSRRITAPELRGVQLQKSRRYGESALSFYKRVA